MAYVTPSHQYPTGIVMPVKRRMELLRWANEAENVISLKMIMTVNFVIKGSRFRRFKETIRTAEGGVSGYLFQIHSSGDPLELYGASGRWRRLSMKRNVDF